MQAVRARWGKLKKGRHKLKDYIANVNLLLINITHFYSRFRNDSEHAHAVAFFIWREIYTNEKSIET